MADGDTFKFPSYVTFNDDEPKGCAVLFLTINGLEVKSGMLGLGKAEPKNATIKEDFQESSVEVKITLNEEVYLYKKKLPEDIDPKRSKYKVKDKQVILTLRKATPASWAEHAKYLCRRD